MRRAEVGFFLVCRENCRARFHLGIKVGTYFFLGFSEGNFLYTLRLMVFCSAGVALCNNRKAARPCARSLIGYARCLGSANEESFMRLRVLVVSFAISDQ